MIDKIIYYADYDEEIASYCVFNNDTGKAHGSYATQWKAEQRAEEMNKTS